MHLRIDSQRWFCEVPNCPREIFAERFDGVLAYYAQRTHETIDLLTTFAPQAGGEGGARLARKAGVPIGPDTLLHLLHAIAERRWAARSLKPRPCASRATEGSTAQE